jgi:hypothetical protein
VNLLRPAEQQPESAGQLRELLEVLASRAVEAALHDSFHLKPRDFSTTPHQPLSDVAPHRLSEALESFRFHRRCWIHVALVEYEQAGER